MIDKMKYTYIPHIDGLRALAVLAVLFYHFEATGFGYGFLGVDIFFTLSGFLVTRIIIKDLEQFGHVRFKRFFARRVRRLWPALAAVCFFTALLAYSFFDAERLSAFGHSLSAAILSLSNILFWTQSGYFDTIAASKPLLHTWSLSVEEQFYLLWPLSLFVSYKLFKKNYLPILSISAFIFSVGIIAIWSLGSFDARAQSSIFYWMPFRIFEFMIGAMAVLVFSKFKQNADLLNIAGFTLLISALILLPKLGVINGPVLGFVACLGTIFIVLSPEARISQCLLSDTRIRWIGHISYSLYLVHWPVWIFAPAILKDQPYTFVTLTIISVLLTLPIYYFIETPLRRGPRPSENKTAQIKPDLVLFGLTAIALIGFGQYLARAESLPFRNEASLTAAQISKGKAKRYSKLRCNIGGQNCDMSRPKQVLFLGNSHEPDAYNSFYQIYGKDKSVNLISFGTTNGCAFSFENNILKTDVTARQCKARVDRLNDLIDNGVITHIVNGSNLPYARNKVMFWEILESFKARDPNIEFISMGGFLNTNEDCSTIINKTGSFGSCFDRQFLKAFDPDERKRLQPNLEYLYLDIIGLMCETRELDSCITSGYGEPVFYDQHHRSLGYSMLIGDKIKAEYADALRDIGLPVK